MLSWPPKDPDAVLDYQIDWSKRFDGDTISASAWTIPAGITNSGDSFTSTAATIWLSGGTDGEKYTLTNRVTTAGGRTDDQSVEIFVRSR
jgi:hypothetical protein